MAICVDSLQTIPSQKASVARYGNKWCHLFTDENSQEEDLHLFAEKLGLKRAYFQDHRLLPHYDLTPTKRALALKYGAVERQSADIVRQRLKERKL